MLEPRAAGIIHILAHQGEERRTHAEGLTQRGPKVSHLVDGSDGEGAGVLVEDAALLLEQVLLECGVLTGAIRGCMWLRYAYAM